MTKSNIEKTLEVNKKQREFYNSTSKAKKNLATRIWSSLRNNSLSSFRKTYDIKDRVYEEHKAWLGDLSDKKVLDLGCLRGNALSIYMAKNAKEYVGIDLSDVAIEDLKKKLKKAECSNARAIAVDFLSDEFTEDNFDVIYAYGVLHHFEDFDLLISHLKKKLAENGVVISYDPLETSTPIKILRGLYRPFQSDKAWEWPFKKRTLQRLDENFTIRQKRGILGKSKYGIMIHMLPLSQKKKAAMIRKWIDKDWQLQNWADAYKCMHITMLMEKQ